MNTALVIEYERPSWRKLRGIQSWETKQSYYLVGSCKEIFYISVVCHLGKPPIQPDDSTCRFSRFNLLMVQSERVLVLQYVIFLRPSNYLITPILTRHRVAALLHTKNTYTVYIHKLLKNFYLYL